MEQRGGAASVAVMPCEGRVLRQRHVAPSPHVSAAQDRSHLVYVVRVRNTDGDDWATLVRTGRVAARLSQQALADAIGASRWTILRWEGNTQKPENAEIVAKLANVIRVDFDRLMRAAGLALAESESAPKPDPRLIGLDPNDRVVKAILALDVSEARKGRMLNRRRQILADRERADLEEIEFLVDPGTEAV